MLAANQGLYNGFLAAGLVWGLSLGAAGTSVKLFFLACVIVAGVYGAATVGKKILFVQALPAAIALALVLARLPDRSSVRAHRGRAATPREPAASACECRTRARSAFFARRRCGPRSAPRPSSADSAHAAAANAATASTASARKTTPLIHDGVSVDEADAATKATLAAPLRSVAPSEPLIASE